MGLVHVFSISGLMGLAMSAMAFGADSDLIGKWSRPTQWADNNVVETITLAKVT